MTATLLQQELSDRQRVYADILMKSGVELGLAERIAAEVGGQANPPIESAELESLTQEQREILGEILKDFQSQIQPQRKNPIAQTEQTVQTLLENDANYVQATSEMLANHAASLPQRLLKTTYRKVGDRLGDASTFLFRLRNEGLTPVLELQQWAFIRELLIPLTLEGAVIRGSIVLLLTAAGWHVGSSRYEQWKAFQTKPQAWLGRSACLYVADNFRMPGTQLVNAGRCPMLVLTEQVSQQ